MTSDINNTSRLWPPCSFLSPTSSCFVKRACCQNPVKGHLPWLRKTWVGLGRDAGGRTAREIILIDTNIHGPVSLMPTETASLPYITIERLLTVLAFSSVLDIVAASLSESRYSNELVDQRRFQCCRLFTMDALPISSMLLSSSSEALDVAYEPQPSPAHHLGRHPWSSEDRVVAVLAEGQQAEIGRRQKFGSSYCQG
ncbi:hypothetical protein C8J56DRAFT_1034455 [Mycena floridula]|nr:hypothetical protein C8J56DRAFT_1034455 [Mycena floridula]